MTALAIYILIGLVIGVAMLPHYKQYTPHDTWWGWLLLNMIMWRITVYAGAIEFYVKVQKNHTKPKLLEKLGETLGIFHKPLTVLLQIFYSVMSVFIGLFFALLPFALIADAYQTNRIIEYPAEIVLLLLVPLGFNFIKSMMKEIWDR